MLLRDEYVAYAVFKLAINGDLVGRERSDQGSNIMEVRGEIRLSIVAMKGTRVFRCDGGQEDDADYAEEENVDCLDGREDGLRARVDDQGKESGL